MSVLKKYSGNKWKAIKNSSWGINHVSNFNDRPGYVICYNNKTNELIPLCSVIGQPNVTQLEIDSNAILIENSPLMAILIEKIAFDDTIDLEYIVTEARKIYQNFI
jgi:hypothetical protein